MTKRVAEMTPEERAKRNAYASSWRKAHPESTALARRKFWAGNQESARKRREASAIWTLAPCWLHHFGCMSLGTGVAAANSAQPLVYFRNCFRTETSNVGQSISLSFH